MSDPVTGQAQEMLSGGCSRREVANQLGVRYDTLRKAINQGRLREPAQGKRPWLPATRRMARRTFLTRSRRLSDKSEPSVADASAEMGVGCTRPEERNVRPPDLADRLVSP